MTIGILSMVNDEDLSMKARGSMADIVIERVIDDVSMLKALADPIRMTLLDLTMSQPDRTWTARELAAQVGVLPTNIYYHLNMLERHGLLQVRDTRVVNGIIEKHYGAGQRSVTFHRQANDGGDETRDLALGMIDKVRSDIHDGLKMESMTMNPESPDFERMMVTTGTVRIPEDQIAGFRAELKQMAARYEGGHDDDHRFTILIAIYPS
jgi:DNA-binding transcriptional ArsR family regulator